jgi:hypothetical protein
VSSLFFTNKIKASEKFFPLVILSLLNVLVCFVFLGGRRQRSEKLEKVNKEESSHLVQVSYWSVSLCMVNASEVGQSNQSECVQKGVR